MPESLTFYDNRALLLSYSSASEGVNSIRPELLQVMPKYITIRDCLQGEHHIKSLRDLYLPIPWPDRDVGSNKRYEDYLMRASFLGATSFTQRTFTGKMLSKEPTIELPDRLKPMRENATGDGTALGQFMELALAETFAMGRGGIYTDFATVATETISQRDSQMLMPILMFVRAEDIINWRLDKTTRKLVQVVIREVDEVYTGFKVELQLQYRVLSLEEGRLAVRIFKSGGSGSGSFGVAGDYVQYGETEYPTLPGGAPWTEIPFSLIGANDNGWDIDESPLSQIALLDLSLYRNSADVEYAAFLVGQATPWVTGVDQTWLKDAIKHGMRLGSRNPITAPEGAKIGILQPSADTMLFKLIDDKHKLLRGMGAIIGVDEVSPDLTATGATYQALQAHAPLVSASRNVQKAVYKALRFAAQYVGVNPDTEKIDVRFNSDLIDRPIGITGLQTVIALTQAGLLLSEDAHEQMRIHGLTDKTWEQFRKLREEEGLDEMLREPAPRFTPEGDNAGTAEDQSVQRSAVDNADN